MKIACSLKEMVLNSKHWVSDRAGVFMSYFLFVDESGHDRKLSPAEVLGGFAIRDGAYGRLFKRYLNFRQNCSA